MKKRKKIRYTDEPIGPLRIVPNFLPPRNKLIRREDVVDIMISINKTSLDYFKKSAKRYHTKYKCVIQNILDRYVKVHEVS